MVERICPVCQHGNPLDNRYCGACGRPIQPDALARVGSTSIVIAGQELPVEQMKQVGKVLAVSLATVAAEVGMAWLRRKVEAPRLAATRTPQVAAIARQDADLVRDTVTIVSQRVVEIWEQGHLARQVVEKHVWRKEQ